MNLKEIVNRHDSIPIQQDEAFFVISEYIKIRKGVDVQPRIENRFGSLHAVAQVQLMGNMLIHAICWLKENGYEA